MTWLKAVNGWVNILKISITLCGRNRMGCGEESVPTKAELHKLYTLFLKAVMQVSINSTYQIFETQHHAL